MGLIPDLPAVDAYIDGLPTSDMDGIVVSRLFEAAKKGNWLARLQAFSYLSDRMGNEELAYFSAKIFSWLIDNDVGGAYSLIGYEVESSGYYGDSPGSEATAFDIYAALHNGYPAQYKVGTGLLRHDNQQMAAVGRKMVECAMNSLPSYRRVFTGEAKVLRAARQKKLYESSYTDLHWAVLRNQADKVREILARDTSNVNVRTEDNRTPIEFALLQEVVSQDILKMLIEAGAEIRSHGDVHDQSGKKLGGGLLSLAIRATAPNVDVVRTLVEAGAEPFNPPPGSYAFEMPLIDAFLKYEEGKVEILNYLISTSKLDKNSELAKRYLVESVGKWKVFNRLLDYGISPVGAEQFFENLGRSYYSLLDGQEMLATLIRRYPQLQHDIKGAVGYDTIRHAVYDCNFQFANTMIAFGAPLASSGEEKSHSIVRTLVERCGRTRVDEAAEVKKDSAIHRKAFLQQMVNHGVDLNALESRCPAWTDFACNPPADDDLVESFLFMGADPYRFYPEQEYSILGSLIHDCRAALLSQALAKPPAKRDANTIEGLSRALEVSRQPIWEGHHCPADFASRTAATLISYGAQEK